MDFSVILRDFPSLPCAISIEIWPISADFDEFSRGFRRFLAALFQG
jgi:hypothetical protein